MRNATAKHSQNAWPMRIAMHPQCMRNANCEAWRIATPRCGDSVVEVCRVTAPEEPCNVPCVPAEGTCPEAKGRFLPKDHELWPKPAPIPTRGVNTLLRWISGLEEALQACCWARGGCRLHRLTTHNALSFIPDFGAGFTAVLEQNLLKGDMRLSSEEWMCCASIMESQIVRPWTLWMDWNLKISQRHLSSCVMRWSRYNGVDFNKIVGRLSKFEAGVLAPETHSLGIPTIKTKFLKELRYVDDGLARLRSGRQEARLGSLKRPSIRRKYYDELQSHLLISASSAIDQGDSLTLDQILEHRHKNLDPDQPKQQPLLFASIGRRKKLQDRRVQVQKTHGTTVLSTAVQYSCNHNLQLRP